MPLLLLYGDNGLEIEEAMRAARAPFDPANIIQFDGRDVPLATVAEACLTVGLFDPQRLVIVRNLEERLKGTRKGGADLGEIERTFADLPPTTTLLLLSADLGADHALVRSARAAGGEVRSFTIPRKGDLPGWVAARGRRQGVAVDRDAAEVLVDLVGSNALLLQSELDKLATYAGDEGRITPAMVETLVGAVAQDSIFSLVDAIAGGDQAQALRLLHAQLAQTTSTPIDVALYLIRMLARQIRILLRIRLGQRAGRPTAQITAELKIPRYYADRYLRQARRLPEDRLRAAFEGLAALEHALKTGKGDPSTGLDLLVAGLCSP